jgi:hypothetical protein
VTTLLGWFAFGLGVGVGAGAVIKSWPFWSTVGRSALYFLVRGPHARAQYRQWLATLSGAGFPAWYRHWLAFRETGV